MTKKDNSSSNNTKLILLIGIPLLIIFALALLIGKVQQQKKIEQYPLKSEEEDASQKELSLEQFPAEPVECEVQFETPTQNFCQNEAGPLLIKGTVLAAPAGSRLQTSWFQVEPNRTVSEINSFQINSLPYSFSINAYWPGIKPNDKSIKIRALADLYDAEGNQLTSCSASNTTYWYPNLECGKVVETPK